MSFESPTPAEATSAASCFLYAARLGLAAPESARRLRGYMERNGLDPDTDEDFQQMVANPAAHHYGVGSNPDEWPWPDVPWAPDQVALGNLRRAQHLIDQAISDLLHGGTS